MAYNKFAYWYDSFNAAADYDRLCEAVTARLRRHGVDSGLVADLGCGTGELTLRLAAAGYDMIAVDASEDMLSVLRDKLDTDGGPMSILLLHQPLEELDLYGTVKAAISTFDTFNHIPRDRINKVLSCISLFLEPGGVLVFDANTPYKHQQVLAGKSFQIPSADAPDVVCHWQNTLADNGEAVRIKIEGKIREKSIFIEEFYEYTYPLSFWQQQLADHGFEMVESLDGECFHPISHKSQRFLITAIKK